MIFSSLTFLYFFLPCMLAVYYAVPKRFQNAALLFGSLFFYAWGEPQYVFLMGMLIFAGYGLGLLLETYKDTGKGRWICMFSVGMSLSFLLYFKYTPFLLANIYALTGAGHSAANVVLPVGISFYTFQMISYFIDVYRGEPAQKNIVYLAVYITMFPQLIAGPIVRYSDIAKQLEDREHSWDLAAAGIRRFVSGMAKKILIANQLLELCGAFYKTQQRSVLSCWLYAAAFMLYIYFDFSGYSDMAIGLGRMFGFQFLENFRDPYTSKSITEFWRQWHISLGTWFRDYVYIPMGGSRVGKGRQLIHIAIVWMLTGMWHGAAWNFAVWGLYFALLLMTEKLGLLLFLHHHPILSHVYTLFFVMVSFIIFDAPNLTWAWETAGGLFGAGAIPIVTAEALYHLKSFFGVFLLAAAWIVPAFRNFGKQICSKAGAVFAPIGMAALLFMITAYLADGSFESFLYFRF